MDLEKGKQIFWEFSGNRFHIDREEYKKCEVPKNTEQQWLNEIKIDLLSKIKVSKGSAKLYGFRYIPFLDTESAIDFLIAVLKQKDLDTFSTIILSEKLKQHLSCDLSEVTAKKIKSTLAFGKEKMLTQKIEIDDRYKSLSYMADYDFSDENILKRIRRI